MFAWLKKRRRRHLLETPFPENWQPYLEAVTYYRCLAEADQSLLRDALRIFIAEKTWEGCRGLVVTEAMQVTIAAMACLLILHLEDFYFDNVQTILLYPKGFRTPDLEGITDMTYLEGSSEKLGEAHYRGPVILSWNQVLAPSVPGLRNLVFHEFAHQLDMLNGEADGVPSLPSTLAKRWQSVMTREYARLCRQVDRGEDTLLDPYGAENPAEFFSIVSECFFQSPAALRQDRPKLYGLMRDYYRQDPAAWQN